MILGLFQLNIVCTFLGQRFSYLASLRRRKGLISEMVRHYFMLLQLDIQMTIGVFLLETTDKESVHVSNPMKLVLHPTSPFANDLPLFSRDLKIIGKGELWSGSIRLSLGHEYSIWPLEKIRENVSQLDIAIKPGFCLWYAPMMSFCTNIKILCVNVRHDVKSLWQEVASLTHTLQSLTLVGRGTNPGNIWLNINFPNLACLELDRAIHMLHGVSLNLFKLLLQALGKKLYRIQISSD